MTLKLGLIGMSEGNGHPYSWGAIINGYNKSEMLKCPFPVIPEYLAKQNWPFDQLQGAQITHIWTQCPDISAHIAAASLIDNVVENPEEMIDQVDAILYARDDAENHLQFSKPFIEAGLPIYIDKPIALNIKSLKKIYDMEQFDGQIFTCSALRYAKELKLNSSTREKLGEICHIHAITPKSWDKYSIHIIEPVLKILNPDDEITSYQNDFNLKNNNDGARELSVLWKSGIITRFFTLGRTNSLITINIYGTKGNHQLVFKDTFLAFKEALSDFIIQAKTGNQHSSKNFNKAVVSIIEAGRG